MLGLTKTRYLTFVNIAFLSPWTLAANFGLQYSLIGCIKIIKHFDAVSILCTRFVYLKGRRRCAMPSKRLLCISHTQYARGAYLVYLRYTTLNVQKESTDTSRAQISNNWVWIKHSVHKCTDNTECLETGHCNGRSISSLMAQHPTGYP